jgi:xanthine dehydrogenase accessory factor
MEDILDQVRSWVHAGHAVAMATVVNTWGSSPRAVGARMAIRDDGSMVGSVSGGCVEGAVVQEALGVLGGGPPRLLQYGVSDETAWDVGLACGGSIDIFVQRFRPEFIEPIAEGHETRRSLQEATIIAGPESLIGTTGIFDADGLVAGDWTGDLLAETEVLIAEYLERGVPGGEKIEVAGSSLDLFIDSFLPSATMIMIGGVHISVALSKIAQSLGYRTIVIDPRKSFAAKERFPAVDQIIQHWPEEGLDAVGIDANTAIAVLTHDPKIDDPALLSALRSPAFYVGALGSRATHAKRVERLRKEGLKSGALARLKAPIGLDLGGRTPEEIALSILAEITATRHGKMVKDA